MLWCSCHVPHSLYLGPALVVVGFLDDWASFRYLLRRSTCYVTAAHPGEPLPPGCSALWWSPSTPWSLHQLYGWPDGLAAGCIRDHRTGALIRRAVAIWALGSFTASCSGTGARPRCSWVMWAAPFWVPSSPAWCSRPPAGKWHLATSWWPLPCWETLASV